MCEYWLFILLTSFFVRPATQVVLPQFVTSTEDSTTSAIEGFGTDLQCIVNFCKGIRQKVKWYKDDQLIAEDQKTFKDRTFIKHDVVLDSTKDCSGQCVNGSPCKENEYCLDNACCPCTSEEYTLAITNLSMADHGTYKCSLEPGGNSVEIRLIIMEGSTFPAFTQNFSFDYSKCCEEQKMSPECLPLCKPSTLETVKFDPVPCQKQFNKLLHCATQGGNVSHDHCCRLNFVPPFCRQFCTGATVRENQRSSRLCVYWMPEILYCYDRAYAPYPGPPEEVLITNISSTSVEVCWDKPKIRGDSILYYTVRYQEVPRFPFLGGSIPFLIGDADGPQEEDPLEKPTDELLPSSIFSRFSAAQPLPLFTRRKRQSSLIISAHNYATNETDFREFKYMDLNSTDTCASVVKLKPSTQYSLYVIATNNFGSSLPSLKQSVVTATATMPNVTLPDVKLCCAKNKVEAACAAKLCDIENPPMAAGSFNLAFACRKEFPQVTPCLTDGRDHTQCCQEKGVGGECLKLCNGAVSSLGMSSVLCISLDIQSIYLCYREGYMNIPTPPINVTLVESGENFASIVWNEPTVNLHKVVSYSVFYKQNQVRFYTEIQNATSPFNLMNLSPDTAYDAYVIAKGVQGSSLRSSIVTFITEEPEYDNLCRFGKILRDAYDQPLLCGLDQLCPPLFKCTDGNTANIGRSYCCPTETFVDSTPESIKPPSITDCCSAKGLTGECLALCTYNITIEDLARSGKVCLENLHIYVECGGGGRNNGPCCAMAGVPQEENCIDFCQPPLKFAPQEYVHCTPYTDKIVKCNLEGIMTLPGPVSNFRKEDSGSSWIVLGWDKPTNPSPVKRYEIRLYDTFKQEYRKFNTTGLSLSIEDIKSEINYVAHVITWNNRGSSLPSEPLNVTLSQAEPFPSEDYKPRPPTNVERIWYKQGKANITWTWFNRSVTNKIIEKYKFKVQYKVHLADRPSASKWNIVNTTNNFVILANLTPASTYDIKVTAINYYRNLESVPSETLNILTQEVLQKPFVEISTNPANGVATEGESFTISCKGSGDPVPNLTLKQGQLVLTTGSGTITYVFRSIKADAANEPITCLADNGGQSIKQTYNMRIKYRPVVEATTVSVSVMQDLSTKLYCKVKSYPRAKVAWAYSPLVDNGITVPLTNRRRIESVKESIDRLITFETTSQENVYNVSLQLSKLKISDSGVYYCKACNMELGCSNASVKLTVEPFPVPRGPDYVLLCCQQQDVSPECLSACTPEINIQAYDKRCIADLYKLFKCAKDGIDNRRCCSQSGVPNSCLSYCNGGWMLDDRSSLNLDCARYRSQIVTCVQDSHMYVSSPPTGMEIVHMAPTKVNVTWKPPTINNSTVKTYVLYYKKLGEINYTAVRTDQTHQVLDNLEPDNYYNFTVIAVNNYGFSTFAKLVTQIVGQGYSSPSYSGGAAGTALGVIICLLLAALIVLGVVYFTRNPYHLPTFVLKMRAAMKPGFSGRRGANGGGRRSNGFAQTVDAVAFENPGYDTEGRITGLPNQSNESENGRFDSDGKNSSGSSPANRISSSPVQKSAWQRADLETPGNSPMPEQKGMRYTQLT